MQDALTTFFSQFEPVPWLCYLFPVLALGILIRCAVSLLTFRPEPEVWAWLTTPDGAHIPVTHWESLIGRGAGCDVQLGYPTVSRTHAVLTRYDDGSWTISDAHSKSGVFVNGRQTALSALRFGDVITMGGVNFTLIPLTKEQERIQAGTRTRAGHAVHQVPTLLLLTLFQLLTAIQLILGGCDPALELTAFGGLIGLEWALYLALRAFRRTGFEAETLAFFLCTMGLAVVSSSAPESLIKELLAIVAGVCVFLVVCWSLRDLERAKAVRYLAAVAGIGLLAVYLGLTYLGATTARFFDITVDRTFLVVSIVRNLLGQAGIILFAVVVALACVTTAVGLVSACADYFSGLSGGRVSYRTLVCVICVFSAVVSNFGLNEIIAIASPILSVVYPPTLVLIVLALFGSRIRRDWVFRLAALGALAVSLLEVVRTYTGVELAFLDLLPLASLDFGWVLPAAVCGAVGALIPGGRTAAS